MALAGTFMSHVEQPQYSVSRSKDMIQIRHYNPMVVAQVKIAGQRDEAIREGFKILASYIFGSNTLAKKMEMTKPVTQQADYELWKIRFLMPSKYTLETLPKPLCQDIDLIFLPKTTLAVIRFAGMPTNQMLQIYTQKLKDYLCAEHLQSKNEPLFAFYNPPWTLPFLRRNEVMIEVIDP
jgi:hypothetical protein